MPPRVLKPHAIRAIAAVDPGQWDPVQSSHTDQAMFFRRFGETVSLLDQRFNWLAGHAEALRGAAPLPLEQTIVAHFNGPAKPWLLAGHLEIAALAGTFIKALDQWFGAHTRYLARHHFDSIEALTR